MKKKLIIAFIALTGITFGIIKFDVPEKINNKYKALVYYSYCEPSIRYKIGNIDKRFKMSDETFLKHIKEAELVWEKVEDRDIFVYDPEGSMSASERLITINMVYDTRQNLNTQINQLETNVNTGEKKLNSNFAQYDARVAAFNAKLSEFNKQIEDWNKQGGAPPDEYNKLKSEQESLQYEADELNKLADSLNVSAQEFNKQVNSLNNTISDFNKELEVRPEEGVYHGDSDVIEIYIVDSNAELVHTLAHEFGHAIGIEHIDNEQSIMHPLTSEFLKPTDEDIAALYEVCKTRSIFDKYIN